MTKKKRKRKSRITCESCGGSYRVVMTKVKGKRIVNRIRECEDCGHRLISKEFFLTNIPPVEYTSEKTLPEPQGDV